MLKNKQKNILLHFIFIGFYVNKMFAYDFLEKRPKSTLLINIFQGLLHNLSHAKYIETIPNSKVKYEYQKL